MLVRLQGFGISPSDCDKVTFVTDETGNVVNACTAKDMHEEIPFHHLVCAGHTPNSILRNTFYSKVDPIPPAAKSLLELLGKAKSMVTHSNKTACFTRCMHQSMSMIVDLLEK